MKEFTIAEKVNLQNELKKAENPINWLFENAAKYGFNNTLDFAAAMLSTSPEDLEEYYKSA